MRPEVKKSNVDTEFKTEERCYIVETANDSGDELVSINNWQRTTGVSPWVNAKDKID